MDKTLHDKDALPQKILETTRETERLKQELEALIASGIRGRPPAVSNLPPSLESTNRVQIIKSYDPKHSQHPRKPSEAVNATSSCKVEAVAFSTKPKAYDVKEARQYIKKQRGKRMAELQNKKSSTQVATDIRKEKLQELQQKANEIVKKNVEAKRSRSKSREPPILRSRSENQDIHQGLRSRSHSRNKKVPTSEVIVIESFNCAAKTQKCPTPHYSDIKEDISRSRPPKATFIENLSNVGMQKKELTCANVEQKAKKTSESSSTNRNPNLLYPPDVVYGTEQSAKEHSKKGDDLAKKSTEILNYLAPSKTDLKSEHSELLDKISKRDCRIKSTSALDKHSSNAEQLVVLSNITLRKSAAPIPTETEVHMVKQIPDWLKEHPPTDPYNFINTVKRQLKHVINEKKPASVDVGVQGDLDDLISSPHSGKTDVKSFLSHKFLNLDPRSVKHVELIRDKAFSPSKDGQTVTKPSSCSENDSDTSKNIPSISSESGSSLRRNAEFIKQSNLGLSVDVPPNLDVDRVEKIQLKHLTKTSSAADEQLKSTCLRTQLKEMMNSRSREPLTSFKCASMVTPDSKEIRVESESLPKSLDNGTEKNITFRDSEEGYSLDFVSPNLSKSRESVISFNCAKVSPNRVLLVASDAQEILTGSESATDNRDVNSVKNTSDEGYSLVAKNRHSMIPNIVCSDVQKSMSIDTNDKNNATQQSSATRSITERSSRHRSSARTGEDSQKFGSLLSTLHPSSNNSEFKERRSLESSKSQKRESRKSKSGSEILTRGSISESQKENWLSKSAELYSGAATALESPGPKSSPKLPFRNSKLFRTELPLEDEVTTEVSCKKRLFMESDRSFEATSEPSKSPSSNEIEKLQRKHFKTSAKGLSKSESNILMGEKQNVEGTNIKSRRKKIIPDNREVLMRNITIRSGDEGRTNLNNTNEMHLKFEAEIHLLTDFNKSISRLSEIERAFESLRAQNSSDTVTARKVLQNKDTQTSKSPTKSISEGNSEILQLSKRSTVSSGDAALDFDSMLTSVNLEDSVFTTINYENSLSDRTSSAVQVRKSNSDGTLRERTDLGEENLVFRSVAGMSLKVFDQLIKDEDARIENWKKMIKIREQSLLDRTKGELVWLEMQKNELIKTGNLAEATLFKKKQRGIILKHQQEKLEMQRLKQMQKQNSQDRKALLKKERNTIKNQLFSEAMLSKLKPASHRERNERRLSGPFKVIQTSGTTVHSETSLSKGTDQEIKSIATRTSRTHSVVNIVSETSDVFNTDPESLDLAASGRANISAGAISQMKIKLLMREHALAKRRKTVEELLQWHKKLLDEEKAIEELEGKIGTIITKIPSESNDISSPKRSSKASITEETVSAASMSKLVLERFQTPPSETAKNIPQEETHSEDSNKVVSPQTNYSADFDVDSAAHNSDDQSSISSISQLIEDFSKIEDNILNLMTKRHSEDERGSQDEVKSDSTEATSQMQTNKIGSEASVIVVEELSDDLHKRETEEAVSESASRIDSDNVPDDVTKNSSSDAGEQVKISEALATSKVDSEIVSGAESEENLEISAVAEEPQTTTESPKSIYEHPKTPEEPSDVSTEKNALEEATSPTKEDVSTSRQLEEIEDFDTSNLEHPSTSRQESASPTPSSPDSKEDSNSNISEENGVSFIAPEIEPELPSVIEHDRQSFENKTDEEKAASLSSSRVTEKPKENAVEDGSSASQKTSFTESVIAEVEEAASDAGSDVHSIESNDAAEGVQTTSASQNSSKSNELSCQSKSSAEIKNHVQEILNVASPGSRGDKSPRMQDLCLITYDTSPDHSPESGSPLDEKKPFSLGSEAEELHRKQLAIEQEIKLLKEQQQKEAATPFYIREIPNKPPPPYTPPSKTKVPKIASVIPSSKEEVEQITEYSAKIIHKAYLANNLDNISISENTLNLIGKNIDKGCYKYVFDVCKEIAREHYGQFVEDAGPSWLQVDKRLALAPVKPLDVNGLKKLMNKKLLEMFAFEKQATRRENAIMKWSRKKRDHVDEVLVQEMQAEETTWTNFDKDEALLKDRITNEIMEMLLKDAAQSIRKALQKKT